MYCCYLLKEVYDLQRPCRGNSGLIWNVKYLSVRNQIFFAKLSNILDYFLLKISDIYMKLPITWKSCLYVVRHRAAVSCHTRVYHFPTFSGKCSLGTKLGARTAPLGGDFKSGFHHGRACGSRLQTPGELYLCIYRWLGLLKVMLRGK